MNHFSVPLACFDFWNNSVGYVADTKFVSWFVFLVEKNEKALRAEVLQPDSSYDGDNIIHR